MRQWAIRSANVALFVLGCFVAAQIVVAVLAEAALPPEAEALAVTPLADTARSQSQERKAILDRNLFGARVAGDEETLDEPETEPVAVETRLPLELLGTVASDDELLANAAIMDRSSRKHQVVFIGDRLDGHANVEVIAIRRGTVILQNGSKRERLDLHEEDGKSIAKAPRRARNRPAAARNRPTVARNRRDQRRATIAERIEQLQKQSGGRTTASLYSQARIVPEWSEGEMVGVRLNQVKPGSLYEKLGIESGDVITTLNGISIDSPQASSRLLTEFTQAEEFTIELKDGQVIDVNAGQLSQMLGD
jgi:general secretion pathway protein C